MVDTVTVSGANDTVVVVGDVVEIITQEDRVHIVTASMGSAGPMGPAGPQGPQGPQGEQGPAGEYPHQPVFISDTQPDEAGPYLWIQTGLENGGFTFWVNTP